jgi:hypothetical protein
MERAFAWLNRCRRSANDFESRGRNALAFNQTGIHPADA